MPTNAPEILEYARTAMRALAPTRDAAARFLEHTTGLAFENAPIKGRDGFDVEMRDARRLSGFGRAGQTERQMLLVVKLGSAPFGTDKERESNLARDIERVTDVFDMMTWPVGTSGCFYETAVTDKLQPTWWITEIRFRIVYWSLIAEG